MSLASVLLYRGARAIASVFIVIILTFLLIHLAPGNPIVYLVGQSTSALPASYIQAMEAKYGLNLPLDQQLLIYLENILSGNLGTSIYYKQPALQIILQRIPATLLLMIPQLIISSVLGVYLGLKAGSKFHSKLDRLISSFSVAGFSIPAFWLAMILILVFAIRLGWLPALGMTNIGTTATGLAYYGQLATHMLLPLVVLVVYELPLVVRITRNSVSEVLTNGYIVTAVSKGLPNRTIATRHALPNAFLPVITIIGLNAGYVLAGAVLVETVFAWPGIGTLLYNSILERDYPVILGILIIGSILVAIVNIITDVLYSVIDPRVRTQ